MNSTFSLSRVAAAAFLALSAPLDAETFSYTRLHNAANATGESPGSSLIEGSDGRLYGVMVLAAR